MCSLMLTPPPLLSMNQRYADVMQVSLQCKQTQILLYRRNILSVYRTLTGDRRWFAKRLATVITDLPFTAKRRFAPTFPIFLILTALDIEL